MMKSSDPAPVQEGEPESPLPAFDFRSFLKTLPHQPGVYCMRDADERIIYIGKARDLKKRVSSYFRANIAEGKTRVMVRQIRNITITVTNTETEALILEHNLIKAHRPRYNVLLRDDKSYPYLAITAHRHPRLMIHRGSRKVQGEYFGPYPSGGAVRDSLQLLQKLFPVRQCEDSYYQNRQRPCLQYQLKRCLAPCCAKCSDEEYQQQVELVTLFLKGRDQEVIARLVAKMETAAHALHYEQAAQIRDQIQALRKVQEQNSVTGEGDALDVLAMRYEQGIAVIHLLMIRKGQVLGSRSFTPKVPQNSELAEIQHAFLLHYYLEAQRQGVMPKEILLEFLPDEHEQLTTLLSELAGHRLSFRVPQRGEGRRFLQLAQNNALNDLQRQALHKGTMTQRFTALQKLLGGEKIRRMECFDISHTFGEKTVASCVVFDHQGPVKSEYRRFNIAGITPGDDYAAMAQAIERRFSKVSDEENVPDILFIDGGAGQLNKVTQELKQFALPKSPRLIGVAKGVTRKPGLETLIMGESGEMLHLSVDDPALLFIQYIRDESHRFAISGHRHAREKVRRESALESVPGVGPKRRQTLLKYLGGMQEVKKASVQELAKVPGISEPLAQEIYRHLHSA